MGPHAVRTGQKIYVNDSRLILGPTDVPKQSRRSPEVSLRLYLDYVDPMLQLQGPGTQNIITETNVVAATAMFGGDPAAAPSSSGQPALRFGHGDGVRVVRFPDNSFGCSPYSEALLDNEAVVVKRGDCTFLEKLVIAQRAGASGVIVLGNEDNYINPSADKAELVAAGLQLDEVAIVVLRKADTELVAQMLDSAERHGLGTIRLVVEPWGGSVDAAKHAAAGEDKGKGEAATEGAKKSDIFKDATRVLYLNNHPLLNTRLLV